MKRLALLFFLIASAPAFAVDYSYNTASQALSACQSKLSDLQSSGNTIYASCSPYNPANSGFAGGYTIVTYSTRYNYYYRNPDPVCEDGQVLEGGICVTPPLSCNTDTIAGSPIMGGSGSGIYDVQGCAYTCGTNYSKLDGFTSLADAQECVGTGQEYVSAEPSDYSEPPPVCTVKDSLGDCLDMDKQQGGACPSGTTYGRLNDTEVCVPSGTSPEPLDPGSQGLPEQGGDMQAEGTPDRAGTGGSSTGTGTGSSSGTSTTTDNGDGTSTTVTTETKETNGPSTVGGHGDPASWWESNYPDGASGIASKFSEDVGNGPFMAMLNPLKSLPDGGVAPSWSLDFGIGQMGNYGSHSFELPAGVWAFVRFAILFTTVMTVRKLIFGG